MARATRESVAYQDEVVPALGRFDTRRSNLRPVESAPVEHKAASGKKTARIRRLVTPLRAVSVILIALMGVALIYSNMQITELTSQIGEREATLSELKSTGVSLNAKRGLCPEQARHGQGRRQPDGIYRAVQPREDRGLGHGRIDLGGGRHAGSRFYSRIGISAVSRAIG